MLIKLSTWSCLEIIMQDEVTMQRLIIFQLKTKDQLDVTCYFYFTSYALNMFRTLIYPSSGAYDYSVELPHWSCVLGSMCVGVTVWLGWSGVCVAGLACNADTTPNQPHRNTNTHISGVVYAQHITTYASPKVIQLPPIFL